MRTLLGTMFGGADGHPPIGLAMRWAGSIPSDMDNYFSASRSLSECIVDQLWAPAKTEVKRETSFDPCILALAWHTCVLFFFLFLSGNCLNRLSLVENTPKRSQCDLIS